MVRNHRRTGFLTCQKCHDLRHATNDRLCSACRRSRQLLGEIDVHRTASRFGDKKMGLGKMSNQKTAFSPGNRGLCRDRFFEPRELPRKTARHVLEKVVIFRKTPGNRAFSARAIDRDSRYKKIGGSSPLERIRAKKRRNLRENEASGDSRSEKMAFRSGKATGKNSRNAEISEKTRTFTTRDLSRDNRNRNECEASDSRSANEGRLSRTNKNVIKSKNEGQKMIGFHHPEE
jgi:hypothetical protein